MGNKIWSDKALIEAIGSGDRAARNGALKSLYMDDVVNATIARMISDYNGRQDPDDVLQDAIILMDEKIRSSQFRGESKVRSFLIGICKNIIRNGMRNAEKVVFKEELVESNSEFEVSPEDQLLVQERSEHEQKRDQILYELLGKLTARCRDVLNLYYFKSYSMAQIADEKGLSSAAQAKKDAFDCRKMLRSLIASHPTTANFLMQWK